MRPSVCGQTDGIAQAADLIGKRQSGMATQLAGFFSNFFPGGRYGTAKWSGGNGIDIFGSGPIYAPFDGIVSSGNAGSPGTPTGSIPYIILQGTNGIVARFVH